jgi:hypothetical protein
VPISTVGATNKIAVRERAVVRSNNAAEPHRQGFIDAVLFLTNAILPVCRPMPYRNRFLEGSQWPAPRSANSDARPRAPRQVSSLGLGIMWQGCNIGTIIKGTITGEDEADKAIFGNPIFAEDDDAESADVEGSRRD